MILAPLLCWYTETSQPLNVEFIFDQDVSQLAWTEPEFVAGELSGYQVLASLVNDTDEAVVYLTEDTHFDLSVLDGSGELYYLWVSSCITGACVRIMVLIRNQRTRA